MIATTVLAAAAGALALATPSEPVEVLPKSIRTASATCGPGATAVSSGFEAPDFGLANDSGVARIGVKQARRRVKVRAYNFGEDRGRLIAHAYCLRGARAPVRSFARTTVAPGRAKSVVAVCPRGTTAISGGFSTGAFNQRTGPRVLTVSSKRAGARRWRVQAIYLPEDDPTYTAPLRPGKLVAYANCARSAIALTTVAKRVNVPAQPSDSEGSPTRTFRVSCPRGSRALSGGFDGNLTFRNEGSAAGAVTSMRTRDGRGWRTAALSISDRTASKVTAYVYCLPRAG